jgi:succinyl-diaminopimelate desuccinylase
LNGSLVIKGVQGHVAYPADVVNPIHQAAPALAALTAFEWDQGNDYYPPTSLQISNIHAGTGATNVVPGELEVIFNLRFNTEQTEAGIREQVDELLSPFNLDYDLQWQLSGEPFLTRHGFFTDAVTAAIRDVTGRTTQLSTSGGTSDGRFIAPWNRIGTVDVVELGPCNATIHKIDERIALEELAPLAMIYQRIIEKVFAAK